MRHADHGGFDHTRHGVDLALDFLRVDVEAARDHEILAAAEDVPVALGIDLAEVAGDEEAVVTEFGFCLLRHPPITLEHVRALGLDPADLVARDLLHDLRLGGARASSVPGSGSVTRTETPGRGWPTAPGTRSPS